MGEGRADRQHRAAIAAALVLEFGLRRTAWSRTWRKALRLLLPTPLISFWISWFRARAGRALGVSIYAAGVRGVAVMPIRPLLEGEAFGPEDIAAISAAFEDALKELSLVDRKDPVVLLVARTTIQLAKTGERDRKRLTDRVVGLLRASH